MLSFSHPMKSANAAVEYYTDERKEDYYLNGIDKEGLWFGKAAERLGLGRTVGREEFRNLLNGFSPDGREALVQNAGSADRQACWDMTFNDPKAVSVFWAMSPLDVRRQIEEGRREALRTVLGVAEEIGGITRTGPGGKNKEPAELLWATFQEGTSRAQDPHLHTHAVLINLGGRQNGDFGSIYTLNLFRWKMGLGTIYQAELASQLHQRLGLKIEPEKVGFGIRGVPQELCRDFSKRRQTIEQTMYERGLTGAVAAKTIAKATRPQKEEVAPDLLFAHWQEMGKEYGWSRDQATKLIGAGRRESIRTEQLDKLVAQAIQEVPTEKRTRSPMIRQAARLALESGADGQTLFQSLTKLRLSDGRGVLWRPHWQGRTASPHKNHQEHREQHESRQSAREEGWKQEIADSRGSSSVSHPNDQLGSSGSLSTEPNHPPPSEQSQSSGGNGTSNEACRDRAQTVVSEATPTRMKEHGHQEAKEQTRPTDERSAQAEVHGSGQKTQRDLDQPRPQEDAHHQTKREQAHGSGNERTENARQEEASLDHTKTIGSKATPTRMKEHGIERVKEETRPAGQSTAQAEPDGPSQKTPRDLDQPRPQEDAHQEAKREQAHGFGNERTENARQEEASLDHTKIIGSKATPTRMKEHGHERAKEETRPAGQSTAQAEPDGPGQKTPRDLDQPRPQEDAHQAKSEQARRPGHKSAKNTRQDGRRKRPEEKARPAQSGTRGGRLPKRKSFIRVEWKRLFPKAPNWSPASKLTAPVIVVGHRDPRWWSIRWKKDLKLFEVRVQDRLLFRNAPRWSPFYGMTAPALHFTLKKSKWKAMKRSHESKRSAQEKGQSKDHGHSH